VSRSRSLYQNDLNEPISLHKFILTSMTASQRLWCFDALSSVCLNWLQAGLSLSLSLSLGHMTVRNICSGSGDVLCSAAGVWEEMLGVTPCISEGCVCVTECASYSQDFPFIKILKLQIENAQHLMLLLKLIHLYWFKINACMHIFTLAKHFSCNFTPGLTDKV